MNRMLMLSSFILVSTASFLTNFSEAPKPPRCGHASHRHSSRVDRTSSYRALTPNPSQVLPTEFHHERDLVGIATSATASLRISPVFISSAMNTLSSAQSTFLRNILMPSAISAWNSVLKTVPVSGNLFAHRTCTSVWNTNTFQCAQFSTVTYCAKGFDEVEVPLTSYLGTDYYYPSSSKSKVSVGPTGTGIANSDFAIFVTACA